MRARRLPEPGSAVHEGGVLTASCGPIIQALPYQLPQDGERYAGSAGGIVSTLSLAMTYAVPLALSALSGVNYSMLLAMAVGCFALGVPLMLALPAPSRLASAAGGD